MSYVFVLCPSPACALRFPAQVGVACPLCKTETVFAANRCSTDSCARAPASSASGPGPLALLLDNVRSVFNVGSIFRSADGAGISHLYLCGITPTPEHKGIHKTALGAESLVGWSQHRDSVKLAKQLTGSGAQELWALERTKNSTNLLSDSACRPSGPLVLVLGNEVAGVDSGIIPYCARTVHLPMRGGKESLNVSSAMAVAAYHLS